MQCGPHSPGLVFEINFEFILTVDNTVVREKIAYNGTNRQGSNRWLI